VIKINNKILLFTFFLSLNGCTTTYPKQNTNEPASKVFFANYEKVWRAVMLAIESYPIKSEDYETGIIQTGFIRGDKVWYLPFPTSISNNELLYKIQINLFKGKVKNELAVQVQVSKQNFIQKGFIEDPVSVPSNGLQEKTILYRILREIEIDRNIANNAY